MPYKSSAVLDQSSATADESSAVPDQSSAMPDGSSATPDQSSAAANKCSKGPKEKCKPIKIRRTTLRVVDLTAFGGYAGGFGHLSSGLQ